MGERCSRCTAPSEGWPDGEGGELCQDHWEEDCDESWWDEMVHLDRMLNG